MPTVIAMDVSLSMVRPVSLPDVTEEYQLRHLAIHGINSFLEYMSSNYKLEFISLVAFSYLYEKVVGFTRDFDSLKSALNKLEVYSKTCIETALNGVKAIISEEWSNTTCQQVILVTDGSVGVGAGALKKSLQTAESRGATDEKFPLPFPFPCKLHIVCIGNPNSREVRNALPYYQKLIDLGGQGGEIFTLDGQLSFKSVADVFTKLAEKYYNPFCGNLMCGNFDCSVQLFPHPEPFIRQMDNCQETYTVSEKLEIIGFMDIKDIGSPPTIARHLILPRSMKDKKSDDKENKSNKESEEDSSSSTQEDGKTPSFTVLLHGSLKVESMVAIAKVDENWYGMIYSWADSKKKSNLMIALYEPGQKAVPWVGKFDNLTSCKDYFPDVIYADRKSPFPVHPPDKRSYSQSCVVWIKPSGLQSDIQKVIRQAKKLPEKLHQFYKELNRTRRAALSFGFLSLLDALASMLERECRMLPASAHPSASVQLGYAASQLRSPNGLDIQHTIIPLQTNFASGSNS